MSISKLKEYYHLGKMQKKTSPVSRVTGGDTHDYTNEDAFTFRIYRLFETTFSLYFYKLLKRLILK